MIVIQKRYSKDKTLYSAGEAVSKTINNAPERRDRQGELESLRDKLDMATDVIGKLAEFMVRANLITVEDLNDLVGYDFEVSARL